MRFEEIQLAGNSYPAALLRHDQGGRIWLGENVYEAALLHGRNHECTLVLNGVDHPLRVFQRGDTTYVHAFGRAWVATLIDPLTHAASGHHSDVAKAPMPGVCVEILVSPGDAVAKGQTLMVIESMKMQTNILAEREGVVAEVAVTKGQTFDNDALLVRLQAEEK